MMLACKKCTFYTFLVAGDGLDMTFCPNDGSRLVLKESPACNCCGKTHSPKLRGTTFCTGCGTKLGPTAAPAQYEKGTSKGSPK